MIFIILNRLLRWLVPFYVTSLQGYTWNTFGPLNYALMVVYDWSASVVGLYYGMCSTGATLFIIPTIYLAETRGSSILVLLAENRNMTKLSP